MCSSDSEAEFLKARPPAWESLAAWLKHGLQGLLPRPGVSDPIEAGPRNLHFYQLPTGADATTVWEQLFLGLSVLILLSSRCNLGGDLGLGECWKGYTGTFEEHAVSDPKEEAGLFILEIFYRSLGKATNAPSVTEIFGKQPWTMSDRAEKSCSDQHCLIR